MSMLSRCTVQGQLLAILLKLAHWLPCVIHSAKDVVGQIFVLLYCPRPNHILAMLSLLLALSGWRTRNVLWLTR